MNNELRLERDAFQVRYQAQASANQQWRKVGSCKYAAAMADVIPVSRPIQHQ